MKCSKCGRRLPGKSHLCIYCGASPDEQTSSHITHKESKEGTLIISETQVQTDKLKDLPAPIQNDVSNALRKGNKDVIITEERTIVDNQLENEKDGQVTVSLEKLIALLFKMRNSFEHGTIEYTDYQRFVSNMIKDYMTTLPEDMMLNFAVNEIETSALSDFIDGDILKDLRAFALAATSVNHS